MKRVYILPAAQREIDAAAEWYERQEEGLGDQFYNRVDEGIDRIETNSEGYQVRFDDLRRCNLEQFPWALWFKILSDKSVIVAFFHGRRDQKLVGSETPAPFRLSNEKCQESSSPGA